MKLRGILATSASMFLPAVGALVVALLAVPPAQAQCGGYSASPIHPSAWQPMSGRPHLLLASLGGGVGDDDFDSGDGQPIVGMWHFRFISDGISKGIQGGVPKGAPVDAGYAVWHSDGTEITNSGARAPNTSNFCMGVWARVGPRQYRLNHFGISWDPTAGTPDKAGNPPGALIGPGHIQVLVTVSPDGQSYSGSFSIDQYDESGNIVVHLEGTATGTRINVNTPAQPIF
jgi:hypothetical protein